MTRIFAAAAAISLFVTLGNAAAQPAPLPATPPQPDHATIKVRTTALGHGLYMLDGANGNMGGNITVAVANNGVIMVDASYADMAGKVKAAIAAISHAPIRFVINTHYHGDHTGGNPVYAEDGAIILASDAVRARMTTVTLNADGKPRPLPPEGALPTLTFSRTDTLHLDGQMAEAVHVPPAHTDGDSYVYFPQANVLATGDLYFSNRYPAIDVAAGGGIDGMIAADGVLLGVANDATQIVPGHGPPATKADLETFQAMLIDVRERVSGMIVKGMSEDEVVAAQPLADLDHRWAGDGGSERFLRIAYRSLKK